MDRMLTELLKWGARQAGSSAPRNGVPARAPDSLVHSKALGRFLRVMAQTPSPLLIDLGPVVGGNVEFFGDRLGCRMSIEDIFADVDRHRAAGTLDTLASGFATRFRQADGSVDGILCWDCFDFLDKASVQALAQQLVRLLRPGGLMMALFCTSSVEPAGYTKYEIVDERSLRSRRHAGAGGQRRPLRNGDILRMFQGLNVSESFLLQNSTREMLLQHP
jgi:hypothetical protein